MTNSAGIDNEVEILQSRILAHDAVMDLKLYVQYYAYGRLSKHLIYNSQPVSVDVDSVSLSQWDKGLLEGAKFIKLTILRRDQQYEVEGEMMYKGKSEGTFAHKFKSLPANIRTNYGVLMFSKNGKEEMEDGTRYMVTVSTPMAMATAYAKAISVAPTSKQTSIAEMTLTDQDTRRGLDYLRQLAVCYNRQANADKNEIAIKTEEFVNSRLEKIDVEYT